MKYMLVFYDCNICGKVHPLKAEWALEHKMSLKDWGLNEASEIVESLLNEARRGFAKLHPNEVFDENRLAFSQLFEEGENEEGTDKAKI